MSNGERIIWNPRTQRYETYMRINAPSEPRRTKRQAANPFAHRTGRGQTSDYRAAKIAERTLTVREMTEAEQAEIDRQRTYTRLVHAFDNTQFIVDTINGQPKQQPKKEA